jgi:hypothetical protein
MKIKNHLSIAVLLDETFLEEKMCQIYTNYCDITPGTTSGAVLETLRNHSGAVMALKNMLLKNRSIIKSKSDNMAQL